MNSVPITQNQLGSSTAAFYRNALETLEQQQIPFLIAGAYATEWHTGVPHRAKDLDIVVCPKRLDDVLNVLGEAGYRTELTFPHWLGKVYCGEQFIDVIFNAGNGIIPVDQSWFDHAATGEFLDMPVRYCSVIELIWSKSFVMERERFDGADVIHLLRRSARELDWIRLISRFGSDWRVLLGHLILFGYVYPDGRGWIPDWVISRLLELVRNEQAEARNSVTDPTAERLCLGTLLSREQYLIDIDRWGYTDPRLGPRSRMTHEDVDRWTKAATERTDVPANETPCVPPTNAAGPAIRNG